MTDDRPPVCDYEGSDYQQSFWDDADRAYEDRVEAVALRRLLPPRGLRLLELGAGAGRNTPRYAGFEQVVLLDYSRTQLEHAQRRLGDPERYIYVVADVYRLPFRQGVFDAATMIRTLHHLVDPQLALSQLFEALSDGATFVLEYANKRNIKAILRWLAGRQGWNPFRPEQIEFTELNFNFHPRTMHQLVRRIGFVLKRVLTVSHFRVQVLKRLVPLPLLVTADSLAQWTGNFWQLSPSVFLRLMRPGELRDELPSEIFACPECRHDDLERSEQGLFCQGCGRVWGNQDGIYDFKEPLVTQP